MKMFGLFRDTEDEDNNQTEVATGVEFPSGKVVIEWDRKAFPEDERTEGTVHSHYESVEDLKEASNGEVDIFYQTD